MVTLQLYFPNPSGWRKWLRLNHSREITVWLVFYKKNSDKPSIKYEDAVCEALCFGWIDSIIKKVDDEKYLRKFTLRKDTSYWSEINKKRAVKLIREKRMTSAGLRKIKVAKKNGRWSKVNRPNLNYKISEEFNTALNKNNTAKINFENLAQSYRKQYIGWINSAKLNETRQKRIKISVMLLREGKRLGLR